MTTASPAVDPNPALAVLSKLTSPVTAYTRWLHTRWPAGKPEKLPIANPDGSTNVAGLYIVGDLTGIPLLKFSSDTGTRAVQTLAEDPSFTKRNASDPTVLDLAIVGGGVSGYAAAIEAKKRGLNFKLFEAAEPFSTIVNFPKGKPIFTYPTDMTPAGEVQFTERSEIKEGLLDELHETVQKHGIEPVKARVEHVKKSGGVFELVMPKNSSGETIKAHRVVVGIGRSGNFRKMGIPGEKLDKVYNRLHDPKDYCNKKVLVVGGGDSALETAIALGACGSEVTLSYRKPEFARPKPENIEKIEALAKAPDGDPDMDLTIEGVDGDRVTTPSGAFVADRHQDGSVTLMMNSAPTEVREGQVDLKDNATGELKTLENDVVFSMIGREPPLDFFRKSGVTISGERNTKWWVTFLLMLATFTFFYQWKKPGTFIPIAETFEKNGWFPHNLAPWFDTIGGWFTDPSTLVGTLALSAAGLPGKSGGAPGFWFSLLYCTLIVIYGIKRIKRRKTPYVKIQTLVLMTIQCVPLFLIPYLFLPWMGHNGWFDAGAGQSFADALFPLADYDPHGREYWRAFGLILAWPLFIWNFFTSEPLTAWLIIGIVQTFVLIPLGIYFFGKGVYCGWVCSCGAMAETLGDTHRHKMPHGPFWNRVNLIGQVFLLVAMVIFALHIISWVSGAGWAMAGATGMLSTSKYGGWLPGLNYAWFVDLLWAGILGLGVYFHYSGRVWCRFACPLAALMHIYARFSKFGIVSNKKKCISCNVCTSVCHQGIDIMNFANKGLPMQDPQCVRCSACVQMCPTGVLTFGRVDQDKNTVGTDPAWLAASPVNIREGQLTVNGKPING